MTLFTPNSIDMPVIMYGTFFAGGIVSTANPSYSVDELVFQLRDNGTKAIATFKSLLPTVTAAAEKLGISSKRIILIGDERDPTSRFKHFDQIARPESAPLDDRPREILDPDSDLAFIVYSSGTTGLPKGVMLSHRNIVANLLMVTSSVGKSYNWKNDKVIGILPFYHLYGKLATPTYPIIYLPEYLTPIIRTHLPPSPTALPRHRNGRSGTLRPRNLSPDNPERTDHFRLCRTACTSPSRQQPNGP